MAHSVFYFNAAGAARGASPARRRRPIVNSTAARDSRQGTGDADQLRSQVAELLRGAAGDARAAGPRR